MRVGLLGGTFDPAHAGHAHVADTASAALGLHQVIWLVSPQNPLKAQKAPSLEKRMLSARRFARPWTRITGLEAALSSPYTIDTVRFLKRRYPGVRFFWLMGSDNLLSFHRWKRWRDLPREIEVVVVPRPGALVRGRTAPGGRLLLKSKRNRFLDAPLNVLSSTALREGGRG